MLPTRLYKLFPFLQSGFRPRRKLWKDTPQDQKPILFPHFRKAHVLLELQLQHVTVWSEPICIPSSWILRRSEFVNQLNTLSAGFGQLGVIFRLRSPSCIPGRLMIGMQIRERRPGCRSNESQCLLHWHLNLKATIVIVFVSTRISLLIPVMAM